MSLLTIDGIVSFKEMQKSRGCFRSLSIFFTSFPIQGYREPGVYHRRFGTKMVTPDEVPTRHRAKNTHKDPFTCHGQIRDANKPITHVWSKPEHP